MGGSLYSEGRPAYLEGYPVARTIFAWMEGDPASAYIDVVEEGDDGIVTFYLRDRPHGNNPGHHAKLTLPRRVFNELVEALCGRAAIPEAK